VRKLWPLAFLPLVILAPLVALVAGPAERVAEPAPAPLPDAGPVPFERRALVVPGAVSFLAIGGAGEPASTQVSIEQDLALAQTTFGDHGLVLFAGGAGAIAVHEDAEADESLRAKLGRLFDPRAGREATYRPTTLEDAYPATRPYVLEALRSTARQPIESPLVVYVAGHGEQGAEPALNSFATWGGEPVTVKDVEEALSGAARTVRFVVSTCFSGGFADIVFEDANPDLGPSEHVHCGFFAATWDLEASGCDSNPERAQQEGYSLQFLEALAGRDRDGDRLEPRDIDFDGNGTITFAEAHARARIASRSFDVPTSTSERWLRAVAPSQGRDAEVEWPEERAVFERLKSDLALATFDDAQARLDEIDRRLSELDVEIQNAESTSAARYTELRIALLERWPTIDDPWHREFDALLASDGGAIEAFLESTPEGVAHRSVEDELDRLYRATDELLVQRARVHRLVRVEENLELASHLRARGGEGWARFEALRACENGALAP
jgi:hypothetical protein